MPAAQYYDTRNADCTSNVGADGIGSEIQAASAYDRRHPANSSSPRHIPAFSRQARPDFAGITFCIPPSQDKKIIPLEILQHRFVLFINLLGMLRARKQCNSVSAAQ